MKQLLFASFYGLVILFASSCAPMIENGKDHRHDPQFKKDKEEKHQQA